MKKPEVHEVRLEIVRPGKSHNQLLSPLTPYMALCGDGSPITFNIGLEHQQLLNKLELLRYATKTGDRYTAVAPRLREAEVIQTGNEVARILCAIESLSPELARAQDNLSPDGSNVIVHLRMLLSGSELSLIPFEMAISPLAYPGEGLEFCLQSSLPMVITREIRRTRAIPVKWHRPPKILIAFAEPDGMKVPAKEHIRAIRAALEPWIRNLPENVRTTDALTNARNRLSLVKNRLRVLPNASIKGIYDLCAAENFTHVHILAHGDSYDYAGEKRYGVALCRDGTLTKEVVSGKRLAKAVQAEDQTGTGRSQPLVVTLATCDSGNQTSVLSPGGSIAHDLHGEGIPWVFASQFPLTVRGSVLMAEILYNRLFRGDDPRQILFELRRQLYLNTQNDHDWASLVVYAALPHELVSEVDDFGSMQIKEAINVLLDHADSMSETKDDGSLTQIPQIIEEVEKWLSIWRASTPAGKTLENRLRRAEMIGMHGSTYKRVALLLAKCGQTSDESNRYYQKSLDSYRDSMTEAGATNMKYYWSATQYLCLKAVRGVGENPDTLDLARRLAERDIASNESIDTVAWAHATLAELELLKTYHQPSSEPDRTKIELHCGQVRMLMGPTSFHVASTLRQFKRYRQQWDRDGWRSIADQAIRVLNPSDHLESEFKYPGQR